MQRYSRPTWSTAEFIAFMKFYDISEMTLAVNRKEKNNEEDKRKLTKVLSTILSIEDYTRFKKYTNLAYEAGVIEEPKTSKYLRYIVTYPFNESGLH